MTTWITLCDTCKTDDFDPDSGATDGERLAQIVEEVAANFPEIKTRRHSCLMGCANACNVTIQAEGKLAYTLGRFEVSEEAASGICAYAQLHAQSDTGQVPYRSWPEAIKGHFVTRHLPLPKA